MRNLWIFNIAATVSCQFVSDTSFSLGQCVTEEICVRAECFAEDSDVNSSPSLPLLFATLWHVHSMQHMCVCTMLGFSVCVILCMIHLAASTHSLARLLCFCVCVWTAAKPAFCFLSLKDPLWSERDTSATHTNTTPGQTQWQQVPGRHVQYHKFPW